MSALKKTRASQAVQSAEFEWNFNDTMKDTGGVSKDFGLTNIAETAWDVIGLPQGAEVVGGDLTVETAFDTAAYTMKIGDSSVADRYLASADKKAAARTALTLTGFKNASGLPIRVTITNTDVCTAGKAKLRVQFVVAGKANEVTAGGPY